MALLSAAVLAGVLWPLLRRGGALADGGLFDRAVYRNQLRELEQDFSRGVLSEAELGQARLEIQRRLLAVPDGVPARTGRSVVLASIAGLLLLGGSAGVYLRLGAPGLPAQPFAARNSPENTEPRAQMAQAALALEARLTGAPDDVQGWLLYARATGELEQWEKSRDAYRNVVRLLPTDADAWASYGEVQVMAAEGVVTPGARAAFAQAAGLQPANDVAGFYLALADMQAGDPKRAIEGWLRVAALLPEDAAMRAEMARRIADAARQAGIAAPALPPGAPAADPAGWVREAAAILETLPTGAPVPEQAKILLARAQRAAPDRADVMWYLGVVAARSGDRAEAARIWTRLLPILAEGSQERTLVTQALEAIKGK